MRMETVISKTATEALEENRNHDICRMGESNDETRCENDEHQGIGKGHANPNATSAVQFSTVEITEYPIIAGDNPSVTRGVPLTIEWIPLGSERWMVDDFENRKALAPRRSMTELKIPSSQRTHMLRKLGDSRDEINGFIKAANISRNCRRRTIETMKLAPAQEAIETATRAIRNAIFRRRAKKDERRMLEPFLRPRIPQKEASFPENEVDNVTSSTSLEITDQRTTAELCGEDFCRM